MEGLAARMNHSSLVPTPRRLVRHASAKSQRVVPNRRVESFRRERTPQCFAAANDSKGTPAKKNASAGKGSSKEENAPESATATKELNLGPPKDGESMQLAKIREDRYRSFIFPEEGIEFLVSEQADGRLNLSQTYLHEEESGVIARPDLEGSIPTKPRSYRVLEWDDWISGDVMNGVPEKTVLLRIYLVHEIDGDPQDADLMDVYCLDPSKRMLMKCEVKDLSNGSDDPVLRIRKEGLVLEDSWEAPTNEAIAAEFDYDELVKEELRLMEDMERDPRWKDIPPDFKGSLESLFAGTTKDENELEEQDWKDITEDFEGGLDEEPDVPEVDNA